MCSLRNMCNALNDCHSVTHHEYSPSPSQSIVHGYETGMTQASKTNAMQKYRSSRGLCSCRAVEGYKTPSESTARPPDNRERVSIFLCCAQLVADRRQAENPRCATNRRGQETRTSGVIDKRKKTTNGTYGTYSESANESA